MSAEHHGHAESGTPLTDELIEQLADEAEQGYNVEEIVARRGKRGRPALGSGPSTVESVRLDPDLKEQLARRAEAEGVPVSEVIREALRHHLDAAS
ncbi:MAG TPA: ribbon-helix-helix domain-containing protein [Acidimicrobiales bacterium]|nr:ribbon-helix-helix domain-containing protein [Acidimicrobiales bacterium]